MADALADVDAIIHLAGISQQASGIAGGRLSRLERGGERAAWRRLRSAPASSGSSSCLRCARSPAPAADRVLTEDMEPAPTDAYGRSKLAAERGIAALDIDWVALRLVLVYGEGVEGNMARLLRLSRSPLPLPLGGLTAGRSILALDNLVAAVDCVLASASALKRPLLVADPEPLTIPQMITAMRRGLGRRAGLVQYAGGAARSGFALARHGEMYERLARPLVVDTSALARIGWVAPVDSQRALETLARTAGGRGVHA